VTTNDVKILAVDDNQDNLTTLQAVVADRMPGARVLTATSGPHGLELARTEDPDVILLDIVMPGMDGYEVCRALKADEQLQGIPVLFLTALRTDLASRVTAMDAGAEGFLPKPFDEIELVAQIRAMAKIKAANRHQRLEKDELAALVTQRTCQLAQELAERRSAESHYEGLFREMLNGLAVHEIVTDEQGRPVDYRFLSVNPAFERITGMMGREIVGKTAREVIPDLEPHWIEIYGRVASTGEPVTFESYAQGLGKHFEVRAFRPAPGRFACIFSDISERLRSETEREHERVEKARLEEQLWQSQKMEAIGRLAGGVAHDFNNLTAIVLGYGEMLLGQVPPGEPGHKWVEQIMAAGQRSATLTRQLLAFSRRQVLLPEVLDLNALLRNFEKMLGRALGEDVPLELKLAPDAGHITADPGQIEQVVTNLAINARDAMPLGGRLVIETENVEIAENTAIHGASAVPGTYVLLSLIDSGCGMDQATLDKLFEPFFTTKPKGKGTGLGLATAHGIVRQSGGYVDVASELGVGTTFKVYLPLTNKAPKAREAEDGGEAPRGHGEQVLLVEDEAPLRELCETVLRRLGYRVRAAGTGLEALSLVAEQRLELDLLLTDVIMPDMGGAELAKRLRSSRPGIGVLYMSGYPDEAVAPRGLDPGTPLVQKPFTERGLARKVREVLQRRSEAAGRRVLMIDDDEQYRELVRLHCTKRGLRCVGVDSAAAALTALAAQPFDVLLVDMNIPGTSGARVLQEIRSAGYDAPAIVLTGDVASADRDELRQLGVVQTLEKSSSSAPLLQAIDKAGG